MNSIAAGMESDYSGSDCDMVFSAQDTEKSSSQKRAKFPKNAEPEFVPISKQVTTGNENHRHPQSKRRDWSSREPKFQKQNYFRRHDQGRQPKWKERRQVVQNSQPLDDLRYAIMQGNLDVVKQILSKGIYVDVILKAGWTPLMYASSSAHPEIVLHLLENKADPNYHKDMYTSLMSVCASSSEREDLLLECLRHLVKYGAEVNAHERHLTTPLMFAARDGHLKLVKELLDAGATLNDCDNCSHTALSWAAMKGHGIIVRLLLSKGADRQIVNTNGQSAADIARQNGHNQVATVIETWSDQNGDISQNSANEEKTLSKSQTELVKSVSSNPEQKPPEKYYAQQGELEIFLNGIGLSDLVSLFNAHHLELSDLLIMNDTELEKIGVIQMGMRTKILQASKATHRKEWEKSSLQNLSQQQYISCPDAVAVMANIAKHLNYVTASVTYIRTQVQSNPKFLELAQETASVHDLLDETEDSVKNAKKLDDQLKVLKMHLSKIQDNAEYLPGDLITEPYPSKRTALKRTIFFSFIAVSFTVILWKKPISLSDVTSFIKSHVNFCFGCETWEPKCTEVLS